MISYCRRSIAGLKLLDEVPHYFFGPEAEAYLLEA